MLKHNLIILALLFFLVIPKLIKAQGISTNVDLLTSYEFTVAADTNFHLTVKPYLPKDIPDVFIKDSLNVQSNLLNKCLNENLLTIKNKKSRLYINPLIQFKNFTDFNPFSSYSDKRIGLRINADLNNKLFFYTDFFYSQLSLPVYQFEFTDSFNVLMHYKEFRKITDNTFSYFSFTGELTYQASENIFFHIGNGKHFFGNGYRSLFLSDNSSDYPYFKTTVAIWKIKYVWMLAKLNDFELFKTEQTVKLKQKAAFIHYFSINLTKRINFNFFEAIISNPYDENGNKTGYDAAYFNPIIFYRPVEFYSGTSDNSLMGIGLNLRFFKSLHLYSQFILDDLIISKLMDGSGWWGNKYGVQGGLKAYNLFNIEGLFFRQEFNFITPYTFSHGGNLSDDVVSNLNYGNYHQSLAHPSGANFEESITVLSYSKNRFFSTIKVIFSKKGTDADAISYGGDIYKDYNLRPDDYGIHFLQGEQTKFQFIDFKLSYIINPNYNLRFETGVYNRTEKSTGKTDNHTFLYFGFSTDLFNESSDFQH